MTSFAIFFLFGCHNDFHIWPSDEHDRRIISIITGLLQFPTIFPIYTHTHSMSLANIDHFSMGMKHVFLVTQSYFENEKNQRKRSSNVAALCWWLANEHRVISNQVGEGVTDSDQIIWTVIKWENIMNSDGWNWIFSNKKDENHTHAYWLYFLLNENERSMTERTWKCTSERLDWNLFLFFLFVLFWCLSYTNIFVLSQSKIGGRNKSRI